MHLPFLLPAVFLKQETLHTVTTCCRREFQVEIHLTLKNRFLTSVWIIGNKILKQWPLVPVWGAKWNRSIGTIWLFSLKIFQYWIRSGLMSLPCTEYKFKARSRSPYSSPHIPLTFCWTPKTTLQISQDWQHCIHCIHNKTSQIPLTFALLGGGGCLNTPPPCGFSRIARKRRRAAPPGFHLPYPPSFWQLLWTFRSWVMQGQVTRSVQVTIPYKNFTIAPQLQCLRESYETFGIW